MSALINTAREFLTEVRLPLLPTQFYKLSDKSPNDEKGEYLVYFGNGHYEVATLNGDDFISADHGDINDNILGWMKLPK